MRRTVLLAAALIISGALHAAADVTLYRSNASGMLLGPIPQYRRDENEFVMEVEREGGVEIRRLIQSGKAVRRWETTYATDGASTEREYDGTALSARRAYNPAGLLLWEEAYTEGGLSQKSVYEYSEGRLAAVKVTDSKGEAVYTERYMLTERGALRQVRRAYADGTTALSWYAAGDAGLSEEREDAHGESYLRRFDPLGRLTDIEVWKGGELSTRRELVYKADTKALSSAVETIPAEKKRIDESYDADGLLSVQKVSVSDALVEQTDYTRNKDGKAETVRRTGSAGVEEWRYTYDGSGELATEKYFNKGSLVKATVYTAKGERYEELYKDGELFLRAYYKDEAKTKEEVYENGTLVRVRSFP